MQVLQSLSVSETSWLFSLCSVPTVVSAVFKRVTPATSNTKENLLCTESTQMLSNMTKNISQIKKEIVH